MNRTVIRPVGKLLRPNDVAKMLGVTLTSLEEWRKQGVGPKYITFTPMKKAIIWYEENAVITFIRNRQEQSTNAMESDAIIFLEKQVKEIDKLNRELIEIKNQYREKLVELDRFKQVIRNLRALDKEQKDTIKRLMNSIIEHKKLAKAPPKQVMVPDTEKINALNRELEEKQIECKAQKKKLNRLGDTVTMLSSRIEQLKSAAKPSGKSVAQKQVEFEKARGLFIKQVRRWLVTRETPHELIHRIKTVEME